MHQPTNEEEIISISLEGSELDFWTAKALNLKTYVSDVLDSCVICIKQPNNHSHWANYNPSRRWMQGGPLIEKFGISIEDHDDCWLAYMGMEPALSNDSTCYGKTPLVAVCRCIVKEEFGKRIKVLDHI